MQKQNINISFSQGIDTKSDPKQVVPGKLLILENGVFPTLSEIKKRNGFSGIGTHTNLGVGNALGTYEKELVALNGQNVASYSPKQTAFNVKGTKYSCDLSVIPVIKNTFQQSSGDSAYNASGFYVYAWEDSSGGVRYSVFDAATNQTIVSNVSISVNASKPKVVSFLNNVVITYMDTLSSELKFVVINKDTPAALSAPVVAMVLGGAKPYDVIAVNDRLFIVGANGVSTTIFYYTATFVQTAPIMFLINPLLLCMFADNLDNIWVGYVTSTTVGYFVTNYDLYGLPITDLMGNYVTALSGEFVYSILNASPILAPTTIESDLAIVSNVVNLTGVFANNLGNFFYEVSAPKSYDHYVRRATGSLAGTVSPPVDLYRSVGLATKAFAYQDNAFIGLIHDSDLQPTYFIASNKSITGVFGDPVTTITGDPIFTLSGDPVVSLFQAPIIVGKLAPNTAGHLLNNGVLPAVNTIGNNAFQWIYEIRDQLNAIAGGVFTQTGMNSVTLTFQGPTQLSTLGTNLHMSGAILSMYDGTQIVEHGYNLFPENITSASLLAQGGLSQGQYQNVVVYEWTDNIGQIHRSAPSIPVTTKLGDLQFFGGTTIATTDITGAPPGIPVGYPISGAGIPGGALTAGYSAPGVLSISAAATATAMVSIVVQTPADAVIGEYTFTFTSPSTATFTPIVKLNVYGSLISGSNIWFVNDPSKLAVGFTIQDSPYFGVAPAITLIDGQYVTLNQVATASVTNEVFHVANGSTFNADQVLSTGMEVKGTGIVPNSFIKSVSGNTVVLTTNTNTAVGATSVYISTPFAIWLKIPTLRLTDKNAVRIVVYRTEANETIFYQSSSVMSPLENDKTIDYVYFQDEIPDQALIGNDQLYTTGGEVENIAAPAVSAFTTYKSRLIAITEEDPLLIWYSKQVISGSPVEFSDLFTMRLDERDGALVATIQLDDKLVLFKNNTIYYMVGDGPASNGTANDFTQPQLIATDCGCISKRSIVVIPSGVMFQSAKGIYLLDRSLSVSYIGAPVEFDNSLVVTSAALIENLNQARFTLSNGTMLVFDYFVQQWDVFQRQNGADSTIFQNLHTYIEPNGAVNQETPGVFTDNLQLVPLKIQSSWLTFAGVQGYQRARKLMFLGEYKSPHTLRVDISYDFEDAIAQTTLIPVLVAPTSAYQYRIFLARQKCESFRFTITELQSAPYGEGLSLSDFALEVGVKTGLDKLPAAKSYG